MTAVDFEARKIELSMKFLREKVDGVIPQNTGWAEWCWQRRIYPLEQPPDGASA